MYRPTVLFLLVLASTWSSASEFFTPYAMESNDPVCGIVVNHYKQLFESDAQSTNGIIKSTDVFNPHFEIKDVKNIHGRIKTSKITFNDTEKLVVYHERNHSWRGDIYTAYIIQPEELNELIGQIDKKNTFKSFYPMGSLTYGTNFSWWENRPFQYKKHWYVITEFGDFLRHQSEREVYQIRSNGSSQKVCKLKIFKPFDDKTPPETLRAFSTYSRAVSTIMESPGSCGTSRPEAYASQRGRTYTATSIYRPWALELTKKPTFQTKHFNDWQYKDVWSHREHGVLNSAKHDAIKELEDHYINLFSYTKQNAQIMAEEVVSSLPYRYYSLGYYDDEKKDFSFMEAISSGSFKNWKNVEQDLGLKYNNHPLTALTLAIDAPKQFEKLPKNIPPETVTSSYKKDLLMYAAHMNNYDTVKYLVDSGWPLDNTTKLKPGYRCGPQMRRLNRSALTYAAENASPELIAYLVSAGADINIKDSKGNGLHYYLRLNPRFSTLSDIELNSLLTKKGQPNTIKPSFPCKGKLNKVEHAICKSEGLSIYDRELANAYKKATHSNENKKRLKESQINWIKTRNKICHDANESESMNACIAQSTRARTRYLRYRAL